MVTCEPANGFWRKGWDVGEGGGGLTGGEEDFWVIGVTDVWDQENMVQPWN